MSSGIMISAALITGGLLNLFFKVIL